MKTWLRLTLITMTVGGGFAGVGATFLSLQTQENRGFPDLEILASFLGLYCYVIGSGLVFVCDPQKTRPMMLALAAQIPRISSPVIAYKFCAGFEAFFDVKAAPPGLTLGGELLYFGSRGHFSLLHEAQWSLGVNYFALVMLLLLWRAVRAPDSVAPEFAPATGRRETPDTEQSTTLLATGSGELVEQSPTETVPHPDAPPHNP